MLPPGDLLQCGTWHVCRHPKTRTDASMYFSNYCRLVQTHPARCLMNRRSCHSGLTVFNSKLNPGPLRSGRVSYHYITMTLLHLPAFSVNSPSLFMALLNCHRFSAKTIFIIESQCISPNDLRTHFILYVVLQYSSNVCVLNVATN